MHLCLLPRHRVTSPSRSRRSPLIPDKISCTQHEELALRCHSQVHRSTTIRPVVRDVRQSFGSSETFGHREILNAVQANRHFRTITFSGSRSGAPSSRETQRGRIICAFPSNQAPHQRFLDAQPGGSSGRLSRRLRAMAASGGNEEIKSINVLLQTVQSAAWTEMI